MERKTVNVNRDLQYDLLGDLASDSPLKSQASAASGRVFNCPDRQELYLGNTRLDRYLNQAGLNTALEVARVLDACDWSEMESRYAPTGRAPYSPQSMSGVILYGVMQGVSSLRALERFARADLGCLWVSGGVCPDHASIGRFIVMHEQSLSGELFEQITRQALKATGSNARTVAGDGTVVEAASSHYKLLHEEAIRANVQAREKQLAKEPGNEQYQQQLAQSLEAEQIFEDRKQKRQRDGVKTQSLVVNPLEPQAMVQPQKRKRGKAASYKPSILANSHRVIVAHAVDPSREAGLIPELLAQSERVSGEAVEDLLLDGGYCCEVVLHEALKREINLLCPPAKESSRDKEGRKYAKSEFRYIDSDDEYECPAGERLKPGPQGDKTYKMYRTAACKNCSARDNCTSAKEGRRIRRLAGDEAKEALRQVMKQPGAKSDYTRRQAMVEPVFGEIQLVQGLKRFKRKGLKGVNLEFSLHALALNLSRAVVALLYICSYLGQLLRKKSAHGSQTLHPIKMNAMVS